MFKGWIEENGTAPVKPGTGLTVAVKTLNHDGLQGHKEWLVCNFPNYFSFMKFQQQFSPLFSLPEFIDVFLIIFHLFSSSCVIG